MTNTNTAHFHITSLPRSTKELAVYVRGYWVVENGSHWCPDVSFREDANRTQNTNAGADAGVIRRAAATLL